MKKIILSFFLLMSPMVLVACPPPCADAAMLRAAVVRIKTHYTQKDNELARKYKEFKTIINDVFTLQKETNELIERSIRLHSLDIMARQKSTIQVKSQLKMMGEE